MARQRAKKDTNQDEMVQQWRASGLHVTLLHQLGNGVPDVLVTGYHRIVGQVLAVLVEIKTDKGKLTHDETIWHNEYPSDGPLIIAREADDVWRWFGMV